MTSMFGGGGGYVQPDSRVLTAITESPNPTAADYADQQKFVETVQRHDYAIKALAQQTQQLQKGVNDATENPLQQIQQFLADVVILMGGGQLAEGALDFGDLQYILPVLGALFGIGDGPFPLDLFAAAERFFLGYVVPTKQFTDVINTMIGAWMTVFGIDPKFIKDTKALITAIGELFGEVGNLLPSLNGFFGAIGLGGSNPGGASLGPLGAALGPIIKLFAGINLAEFGNAVEFITSAIDPFIVQLTAIINFIDEVLHVLSYPGDVVNDPLPQLVVPFKNLMRMLGNINLAIESFNPVTAVQSWLGSLLLPISGWSTVQPNLQIDPGFDDSADVGDVGDGKNWTRENLDPPITNGDWVWDLIGRTAAGSATVHANGVDHGILGTVVYVEEGHTFDFDAYLSWTGLTASTGALALHIQTDTGTNTAIASVTSPGATGTWTHLSGSYTVPAGVASIRLRLYVGGGASAGQVWFDDCNIRRTNLVHQGLIQDLEANLATLFGNFTTLLTEIGAGDVVALGSDIATGISNAADALNRIIALITGVLGGTQSVFPWVFPVQFTAPPTVDDLAVFVKTLPTRQELQELKDVLHNSLAGNTGLSYVAGVTQDALAATLQQLHGVASSASDVAQQALANAESAATNIEAAVQTAVANVEIPAENIVGTIASEALPDIQLGMSSALQTLHDDIVNNLRGFQFPGINFFPTDSAGALGLIAATTSAHETRLATLGNGAEEQVDVEFSTYSNGALPGVFTGFATGGTAPTVANGVLTVTGSNLNGRYQYNAATALTDYQQITGIWSTFNPGSIQTRASLYGRMNAATDTDIQLFYQAPLGLWELVAVVGFSTVMTVTFTDTFTPGAAYSLVCGDPATNNRYKFAVLKNGVPLPIASVILGDTSQPPGQLYYIDTSHASAVGASNRFCGMGMDIGNGTAGTIAMSSFKFQDTKQSSPSVLVTAPEPTASTTYTDLPTISDEVVVNIGASGMALLNLYANFTYVSGSNQSALASFQASGANTIPADDNTAIGYQFSGSSLGWCGSTFTLTDLAPGLTIFKMKYRVTGGSGSFSNRRIGVVAL